MWNLMDVAYASRGNKLATMTDTVLDAISQDEDDPLIMHRALFLSLDNTLAPHYLDVVFGETHLKMWSSLNFSQEVFTRQVVGGDDDTRKYVALHRLLDIISLKVLVSASLTDRLMYCTNIMMLISGFPKHLVDESSQDGLLFTMIKRLNNSVIDNVKVDHQAMWNLLEIIKRKFNEIYLLGDWTKIRNEIDIGCSVLVVHMVIAGLLLNSSAVTELNAVIGNDVVSDLVSTLRYVV